MNAIKESFDNLPAAVCIFNSRGMVRLVNRRMLAVGSMLLGSGIQTLHELHEALKAPPPGVSTETGMPGVYRFPDGSILRFSENRIEDRDGQRFTEVIAADVAELAAVRERIGEENARLDEANAHLRRLGRDMADIVREEEILNMKIRVHDDVGYSLLSVRRAYWQCGDVRQLHALAEQWDTTIRLLHPGTGGCPDADPLLYAAERAKELGAEVIFNGEFPPDRGRRELQSLAIRECTSNCIRHAAGTKIFVSGELRGPMAVLTVTNDGREPEGTVTEGGGLSELRRRAEKAGGVMEVHSRPRFSLSIALPEGEEAL